MAHRPPTPTPEKTPDPLINLGEVGAEAQNQRNRQGFLSSFLQGSRNRTAGFLSGITSRQLGNSAI